VELEAALRSFRAPGGTRLVRLRPGEEPARGERGSYALVIEVSATVELAAGRLAPTTVAPGRYVYCGSALGGLRGRLSRHFRSEKIRHWHVDYLLERGALAEVWIARSTERIECLLARELASHPEAHLAISRFGSSDCGCPGHLVKWDDSPYCW